MSRGAYFLCLAVPSGKPATNATATPSHAHRLVARGQPVGRGPNWTTPMEAAIRAANWVVALLVFSRADGLSLDFWKRCSPISLRRGCFSNGTRSGIRLSRQSLRGRRRRPRVPGRVFRDTIEGARWLRIGARMLDSECSARFTATARHSKRHWDITGWSPSCSTTGAGRARQSPNALSADYEQRLTRMYEFIGAYLPPSDEAPMLGDADDSRLHAVSAEVGCHRVVTP